MTELRFQFEVFEGPLDLLLHLVRKEEVDIYEVDMVKIADQFCEYVELMKRFDLHMAGEFIVMASTLMYIKSKELLLWISRWSLRMKTRTTIPGGT